MNSRPAATYLSKAQQVAQDLLKRIVESGVQPGQSFGTEAELLARYEVSRPTLRESIRILEAQGVLQQKPGPGGGLIVMRPSLDLLAQALSIFLRFNDVPFVTVLQAREVIEPALAAEAATGGTEDDFREMAASIARMQAVSDADQAAFIAENRIFHAIVARASGNKVLETFWGTISLLASGEHHGIRYTFGNRRHVIAAHQQILDACLRRNPQAAARAMAAHVGELEHLVRDRYKHLLGKPMEVRSHRGGR
ncbi:MAG: FadR family transcriptional regulator [Burkholderiales bacterium]|nr:FadR family transcriptional regulator [Burkholderiales bacterium]